MFLQREAILLQDEAWTAGDREGEDEFRSVLLRGSLATTEEKLPQPVGEQRQYRQHGTGLDHNLEEVALDVLQASFDDQEMAGGRDRQELGDSFDDTEQNNGKPIWHLTLRRHKRAD